MGANRKVLRSAKFSIYSLIYTTMNYPIYKTKNHRGLTIEILFDTEPVSPKEDFDLLGTIYSNRSNYNLMGHNLDELFCENDEGDKMLDTDYIFLPIYSHEHGGIILSTERNGQYCDTFDSGIFGLIATPKWKVQREYGELSNETVKQCKDELSREIELWNDYLQGNIFAYKVKNSEGEIIDSCSGFYDGAEVAMQEAEDVADFIADKRDKIESIIDSFWID